ncbi:MAG: hypothetical protein AAF399_14540 [Bacteroidota bacterium]
MNHQWIYWTAVTAVIVGFWFLLKFLEKYRRGVQAKRTSPDDLGPRKLSRSLMLRLPGGDLSALVEKLKAKGMRVTMEEEDRALLFWGDAAEVKFRGVFISKAEDFPIRLVLSVSEGSRNGVQAQIDEDFGFQRFIGPGKKAYLEKYEAAFEQWEGELRRL